MGQRNSPKIRFPDFADDWQEYSMGELYTERKEPGNDSLPILSVSIHTGISDGELDEEDLGKHVRRSEDKSTYKHVYAGDLVFNMMRAWQGAIGSAPSEGMISPAYISAVPNEKVYPPFMDYYVKRKEIIEQINSLSYGVTDFRKRLYWDSFVQVKCRLPAIKEQKQIAEILNEYDNIISMQENELKRLKKLKKGLLQKMFPTEGVNVPEIRFPEYCGSWRMNKYAEIIDLQSGQDLVPEDYNENGIGIPYMTGATCIKDGVTIETRWTTTSKCIAEKGNVLLVCKGSGYGTLARLSQKRAHIARQFMALKCKKGLVSEFNYYLANSVIDSIKARAQGLIAGIDRSSVLNQIVRIPETEEQIRIAAFFSNFDGYITLHQRELDIWKKLKKGLLQQMFV